MTYCMRLLLSSACFLAFAVAPTANANVVVSSPFDGGADELFRGFYVENYPASNIDTVTIEYLAEGSDFFDIELDVRLNDYNGPLVGTQTFNGPITGGFTRRVTYDFSAAPVPIGSTLTFTQTKVSGVSRLLYRVSDSSTAPFPPANVIQTERTFPLSSAPSTIRRTGVGLIITAVPEPSSFLLLGLLSCFGIAFSSRRRALPRT